MNILVTGAYGQLGSELREISEITEKHSFEFVDKDSLDITSKEKVEVFFKKNTYDYCVNCAAFTAVDGSEDNIVLAEKVNVSGVKNLALSCKEQDVILIHISTDFVFNGEKNESYTEKDLTFPLNIYGKTKLEGENEVQKILKKHFILRTSWLYSSYGNNFVKTMLRLGSEKESLGVVNDQVGTPTYAKDLAMVIIQIIKDQNSNFGLYHYSNEGVASWYDFAKAIFEYAKINIDLKAISTEQFPLPAIRPKYAVLDKSKIKKIMKIEISHWRVSLIDCINSGKLNN